jgi:hypothetical protein
MNERVILALLGDLYAQLMQARQVIDQLERQLAEKQAGETE